MATSVEFITSSEFGMAWDEVKDAPGSVRLQYRVGRRGGGWQTVEHITTAAAARRWVRGLDGSPRPGRFRLVKGEDA